MGMIGRGPNKVVGPCPKHGCTGSLMAFDGPWFSSKPQPEKCNVCGHIPPPPGNENTFYIGFDL